MAAKKSATATKTKPRKKAEDVELPELEEGSGASVEDTGTEPRFKDFGSAIRVSELPPLYFDLCGQRFHCRPALQSKKLLDFVRMSDSDNGLSIGETIHSFMESVILPEDREAWQELMDSDEYIVDVPTLSEVVTWLVEQYSARPTPQ